MSRGNEPEGTKPGSRRYRQRRAHAAGVRGRGRLLHPRDRDRPAQLFSRLALRLPVLARAAAVRRHARSGARFDRRRVDGDGAAGARRGDRDDAAGDIGRHPGLYRPRQPLQLDAPVAGPRQRLVSEPAGVLPALRLLCRAVEPARRLCAAGAAPRGRADRAGAVLAQRHRADPARVFGQLRCHRLDLVAAAEILVLDLPDDRRRRLVRQRHGHRAC